MELLSVILNGISAIGILGLLGAVWRVGRFVQKSEDKWEACEKTHKELDKTIHGENGLTHRVGELEKAVNL